jgi:hypothetical protein
MRDTIFGDDTGALARQRSLQQASVPVRTVVVAMLGLDQVPFSMPPRRQREIQRKL